MPLPFEKNRCAGVPWLILGILLGMCTVPRAASRPFGAARCPADEEATIQSSVRCPEEAVSVSDSMDERALTLCLQNRTIQRHCGPQGELTRQKAFALWLRRYQEFEANCLHQGGTFAVRESSFADPANASFCSPAQIELRSGMFEDVGCSLRSDCPAVRVACEYRCNDEARLHEETANLFVVDRK